MAQLGFSTLTFAPISLDELAQVARLAEDLGYDRIYTSESLTDTLAVDMWLATQTSRIVISSCIALISLRHPLIMAQAAGTISDVSKGRFILGMGLGHKPRNEAMGVTMGKPVNDMRSYLGTVRDILEGHPVFPDLPLQTYQGKPLTIRRPQEHVPIHIGAVGPKMIELGGEIADGINVYLVPISRMSAVVNSVADSARRAGRDPASVETNLMIHVLVHDDLDLARNKAREALTYWVGLPGYNAAIELAGFEQEAKQIRDCFLQGDQTGIMSAMSDELIDELAIVGPAARCKERIEAIRSTGVSVPILGADPVHAGETYREALERTLTALAP